jgi:hypothetical protein
MVGWDKRRWMVQVVASATRTCADPALVSRQALHQHSARASGVTDFDFDERSSRASSEWKWMDGCHRRSLARIVPPP